MKIKELIWDYLFDPVIKRIERRIIHYRNNRLITHDGSRWKDIVEIGKSVVFYEEAVLINYNKKNKLIIGDFNHIRGEIFVYESGSIKTGTHTYIGPGSRIWCRESIQIGSNVLISYLVDIHDTNAHSLDWKERRRESIELFEKGRPTTTVSDVVNAPIIIEDDVWIGFKATILKGVRVGRGAVIAAGSVVTKDVLPFTVVAGNPACVVRVLPE